ncbi:MAG TPA: NADH-quinone oxidoreductase subunit A [Clostridia bacterium]|nr:NADH-quinone oxidoreductase subunit A [Clostridia bacterium]
MYEIIISPPIAFLILLAVCALMLLVGKLFAARGNDAKNKLNAYACGESMEENQAQPDYAQFFKFAFFFTIMHVVALMVATSPNGMSPISGIYLGVTGLSLFMMFRREK